MQILFKLAISRNNNSVSSVRSGCLYNNEFFADHDFALIFFVYVRVCPRLCMPLLIFEFFFFAFQLLPEHRPPTILCHSARSCILLSASFQLSFMLPSSFSTVLLHVFFGLPLSRQPWGVHLRAFFVILLPAFLIVCPIQVHFLRVGLIVVSMESCSAMFHLFSYVTFY